MEGESWVFRVKAEEGESLGHYLGRFRRANYLSHKAVAEHLGIRLEWVSAWESPSRRCNPSELQLIALSKMVEVDHRRLAEMLPPNPLHLTTRLCAARDRRSPGASGDLAESRGGNLRASRTPVIIGLSEMRDGIPDSRAMVRGVL